MTSEMKPRLKLAPESVRRFKDNLKVRFRRMRGKNIAILDFILSVMVKKMKQSKEKRHEIIRQDGKSSILRYICMVFPLFVGKTG